MRNLANALPWEKAILMSKSWLKEPQAHDFPAAADYLELLLTTAEVKQAIANLEAAKTISKKAKDIFRASQLPLLPRENLHVKADLQKLKKGEKMSPILLVKHAGRLHIADGYHRLCAVYHYSEDEAVPCRLAAADTSQQPG